MNFVDRWTLIKLVIEIGGMSAYVATIDIGSEKVQFSSLRHI